MEKARRDNRLMVSLTESEKTQRQLLASVLKSKPATVVHEIVADYLAKHREEIEAAGKAADAYHASIKNLGNISLFDDEDL